MKKNKSSIILSNCAKNVSGNLTFIAENDIAQRHLFATFSNNPGQIRVADTNRVDAGHQAIGVLTDMGKAGDYVNVQILNSNVGTLLVTAAEAIAPGESITANADGKAVRLAGLAGGNTYFVYGVALQAANANELLEFTPVLESRITI